ncbi:MAG: hypothetical protein FJ224_00580 [Lentisphaerae bacterium]|nr:hypothetical protein [Lentisphaerota bacterium]
MKSIRPLCLLALCSVLGVLRGVAVAQTNGTAAASNEVVFVAIADDTGPVLPATTNDANLISITLDDVALVDVVRMFTRISGANIVASATNLEGRVTVNLTDVQWKPALTAILDMHDLALMEKTPGSAVYSIVPKPADAPEPMVVKTIFLRYATVPEVSMVVSNLLVQNAAVSAFPSRNALVLKTTEANRIEVERVIDEIDKLREQVFIEAKFLELNDSAIRDLGINWQVLEGYGASASPFNWNYSENRTRNNSVAAADSRAGNRIANDGVRKYYDIYGKQIQNETVDFKESPDGEVVTIRSIEPTYTIADSLDQNQRVTEDVKDSFVKQIADIRTSVLSVDDFRLVLSALKQMNGVSIVSNPKLIVANEESAVIHVGRRERPFQSVVTPATETTAPFVTYNAGDPVDTGVKLTVTPTINTSSNITVRIEPELTRYLEDKIAPNGQTFPVVATKKIQTVFCLENGKTVAIGGLTETTEGDRTKKIPLLGDIPLIGRFLFSHTHKEKNQQETIIFVTLGIATPGSIGPKQGLPEDAALVHRKLLQDSPKRKQMEAEIEGLIRKMEAEEKKPSEDTGKASETKAQP